MVVGIKDVATWWLNVDFVISAAADYVGTYDKRSVLSTRYSMH